MTDINVKIGEDPLVNRYRNLLCECIYFLFQKTIINIQYSVVSTFKLMDSIER